MKKLIRALVVVMVATMIPCLTIGQNTASRQYTKEAPLVYEDAWDLWPYVFLNEHGEPEGFNIDMLKLVFKELDIPYVIKLKPTTEALEDLRAGRSDLMLRLAASFHDDYARYGEEAVQLFTHSVVTPKSKPVKIHALEDLGQHKVIVHTGSLSHRMMVDHGWTDNCIPIGDMKEAMQRVCSKDDGMIVWNTLSLKWLMKKFNTANLQITPIDMPHGEYKFMSNDTVLLHKLDSVYAQLCATDRMQPILNKWFYPDRVDSGIPNWLGYAAAVIGVLVFLLLYYTITLKLRERKMTKLIAKHNRRLALILRTTKVRVWLYDVQRKVFVWMGDNGEMDGREHPLSEFADKYTSETFMKLMQTIDKIVKGKHQSGVVGLTSTEDGNSREYVSALSVFRRSRRGVPTMIVGMMDDQTERLLAQRKAKDGMLRYRSIFSTSMVDMTYYSPDGILTDINQKACQTFNCKREDILAEHVPFNYALEDDTLRPETFEGSYSTHLIKVKSNPNLADSINFTRDVYYEQQLIPVSDASNRLLGIFGSGRDVTEFVNSYHQLRRSIRQLTATASDITEYISNINYALHAGGVRLVNYSPSAHTLTVYREMNVVQLTLTQSRFMSLVAEESKRVAMRLLNNMDARDDEPMDASLKSTLRVKGGLTLALQFHFLPIYNKVGDVESYFGLCRDISREQATAEELEREKTKAQEVENVKNIFLRNMSHEIRTPITTVVGFAELFAQEHDPAEEDGFITEIKNNANFLLKLVNDILFLSRLDANMIEFNKAPIDFVYTFEGHCQMGWAKVQKPGVEYRVENPYEHLVVEIDDGNVGKIVEQLVENAARKTVSGMVRTRYDFIGNHLLITVEDTSDGMDQETQSRLFERSTISVGEGGMGLGLPICKELAHQMGGYVYLNSAEGCGTTVWVVIPCTAMQVVKRPITN